MATRLFLRNTTGNTAGYAGTEKSTALPVGDLDDAGNGARDLETTKGSSQTSVTNATLAQTAHQDQYLGKWISDPLTGISSIDANTWTLALAVSESNGNLNAFTVASIYVLKNDDTVRGYIYDSDSPLGAEFATSEDGQVYSLAGSAVASVVSTDRLVVEVWVHATQSMAQSGTITIFFDGTTDVVDSTTTDAASYLETPQDGLFSSGTTFFISPAGSITGVGALNRQTNKALTGTATGSGTVARLVAKVLTATSTGVGAISKLVSKLAAGTATGTGVLATVKIVLLNMAGSITAAGNLARSTAKSLVGSLTGTGSTTKTTMTTQAGTVTGSGTVAKTTDKTISGSTTPQGALVTIKLALLNIAGSITATGALVRTTAKNLAGSITGAGSVTRAVSKVTAGTTTPTGSLSNLTAKSLAGGITAAGSLVTSAAKQLAGTVTAAGNLAKSTARNMTGTITGSGIVQAVIVGGGAVVSAIRRTVAAIRGDRSVESQRKAGPILGGRHNRKV